jgi:hypothetical protein
LKRPAVHDQAMIVEVPSALDASRLERACGLPSMIQSAGIGAGSRSTSAGAAKITGFDTADLQRKGQGIKGLTAQKTVNRSAKMPALEHDPENRKPVFRKDHAQSKS